jgi:acetyltransferase
VERDPHRQDPVLIPDEIAESFQPIIGQAVTLRPLRPVDADIETAFLTGLSPETRSSRLLGGVIKITREYIAQLTHVDYRRDMAIAATVMLEERETLIGVARYVRDADGAGCEFAIVIADAWQGRGIGRRLLEKLLAVARDRGIRRMYGDVLATNTPMLALAQQVGFALSRSPEDATLTRITLDPTALNAAGLSSED